MPFGSVSFSSDTTYKQGRGIIPAENGIITGCSVKCEAGGLGNAESFGQVMLISTEVPHPIIILELCSGYFGADVIISWDGRIKLEPSMAIQAIVFNSTVFRYRLTVLTELP